MVTLLDVRYSLKSGERNEAFRLLKEVLREQPTADAWLIAAQLSRDRSEAIKYVRRALLLEPEHYKARYLLQMFGASRRSFWTDLAHEFFYFIKSQNESSVILKRLSRMQRIVLFSALIFLMVTSCVLAFSMSVSMFSGGVEVADAAPAAPHLNMISAEEMAAEFEVLSSDGLHVTLIADPQMPDRQTIRISLNNLLYNRTLTAEIFIYGSISAMIDDQAHLSNYGYGFHMVALSNAVFVVPEDMPVVLRRQLISKFESFRNDQ